MSLYIYKSNIMNTRGCVLLLRFYWSSVVSFSPELIQRTMLLLFFYNKKFLRKSVYIVWCFFFFFAFVIILRSFLGLVLLHWMDDWFMTFNLSGNEKVFFVDLNFIFFMIFHATNMMNDLKRFVFTFNSNFESLELISSTRALSSDNKQI